MQYTEQQKQDFKDQFAARKKRQIFLMIPIFLLAIALGTMSESKGTILGMFPAVYVLPIFIAAVIGALIFSMKNWRCPACDKYLGKGFSPKFCPKCGVQLSD